MKEITCVPLKKTVILENAENLRHYGYPSSTDLIWINYKEKKTTQKLINKVSFYLFFCDKALLKLVIIVKHKIVA